MNLSPNSLSSTQPSNPYVSSTMAKKNDGRVIKAEVESIDKIVIGSKLPFQLPWKVHQADAKWSTEHPAKVGNSD